MTGKTRNGERERIGELRRLLEEHNRRYYEEARPVIEDEEYDALMRELVDLERRHPDCITPDSPTRRVGGRPSDERAAVRHEIPLLSLENTYDEEEVRAFDERVRKIVSNPVYTVEPKIDGAAIALSYRNGRLVLAATRGDGLKGDDVTPNVRTIDELPLETSLQDLEIRGEIYISRRRFAELNEERSESGEAPYMNPRNLAAGTLKHTDPREVRRRGLSIIIHTALAWGSLSRIPRQSEALASLAAEGFPVIPEIETVGSIEDLLKDLPGWERRRRRYPFDTDGIVVKVDSFAERLELGETSRAPRWGFAFKFEAETAETVIKSIEVQVGRTGALTPVAVLKPVILSGTRVSSASLHNGEEVKRLGVMIGDRVEIKKAGEIIPQVVSVLTEKRTGEEIPFKMPDRCPACGSRVSRGEGEVKERCANGACPARRAASIIYFASRRAMDIEGLGPRAVDRLINEGIVEDIPGIYGIIRDNGKIRRLVGLDGWGRRSAENLLLAIEESRSRPPHRLITALGIPGVGPATARDLETAFGGIEGLMEASEAELSEVPEVGPVLASSIRGYFDDEGKRDEARRLIEEGLGLGKKDARQGSGGARSRFRGIKVVFTGSLPTLDRRRAGEIVTDLGGRASSGVSRKTDLVVIGDSPGSKADKAREYGIETMTAAEFEREVAGYIGGGDAIDDSTGGTDETRSLVVRRIEEALDEG